MFGILTSTCTINLVHLTPEYRILKKTTQQQKCTYRAIHTYEDGVQMVNEEARISTNTYYYNKFHIEIYKKRNKRKYKHKHYTSVL